jgi:hypothetical protein
MVKIEFETNNEAFADAPGIEIARILRRLADTLEPAMGGDWGPLLIKDTLGNTVGAARVQVCRSDCLLADGHPGECV